MHPNTALRAGLLLIATQSFLSCSGTGDGTPGERANRIHEQALVFDAHAHPNRGVADFAGGGDAFETNLTALIEGGLDAVFFNLPLMGRDSQELADSGQIIRDAGAITNELERLDDIAGIALSPDDVSRLVSLGKRAVVLAVEAAEPFGGDIGTLERLFDAGIRMITLPAEVLTDLETGPGGLGDPLLNDFGRRVIEEMNRLGMIIDITHTPDAMQMDIIRTSAKPVVASHSCTRALNDIPRQVPDSVISALAENGGVIAVTFSPGHIVRDFEDRAVTVEELVDHIDHIVSVVGVDHVGFGSDFPGGDRHIVGLETAAGLPAITHMLVERGYSKEDIDRIMGGNLLRIFEAVSETGR